MKKRQDEGKVVRIAGPVVGVVGLRDVRLFDVVSVGEHGLIGEVIQLVGGQTIIQVYEDTSGLRVGEPAWTTGMPLVVELGPGLLGSVYDGLQRSLIWEGQAERFLSRGSSVNNALPRDRRWAFEPQLVAGETAVPGAVLGHVREGSSLIHRVLVPPGVHGRVVHIEACELTVEEVAAVIDQDGTQRELTLLQRWPVRQPRPFRRKAQLNKPLISGTRIIDTFFPVAKGGTAIIPGGFGTGKTVCEQSLARWADVEVVVYVGCGERGNEMAEVLEEFPLLEDPRNGHPLMQRTILIANTSNMPVAAREASIYTGVTIAEYYRDMGYDVLLLADSTSRWGEALREISGRLEEMPGEEGYPAYLATRLSEFYERSGRVVCLGGDDEDRRSGSITIVGAVSPPGGDFSEPITQSSLRVVGTFWALDYDLSRRRHFPAINWTRSYTLYDLADWFAAHVAADWSEMQRVAMHLLQQEEALLEIVQLVGPDALAEEQKALLAVARVLREDFLQQSAVDEIDRFCPLSKAYWMLRLILKFHERVTAVVKSGGSLAAIMADPVVTDIARAKHVPAGEAEQTLQNLLARLESQLVGAA